MQQFSCGGVCFNCSDKVELITSGPILIFELQASNALKRWLDLLGSDDSAVARGCSPCSIRARFGTGLYIILITANRSAFGGIVSALWL